MRPDTAYTTMEVKEMDTSARPGPDMSSGAVSAGCWCGHCLSVSGDVSGSDGDGRLRTKATIHLPQCRLSESLRVTPQGVAPHTLSQSHHLIILPSLIGRLDPVISPISAFPVCFFLAVNRYASSKLMLNPVFHLDKFRFFFVVCQTCICMHTQHIAVILSMPGVSWGLSLI